MTYPINTDQSGHQAQAVPWIHDIPACNPALGFLNLGPGRREGHTAVKKEDQCRTRGRWPGRSVVTQGKGALQPWEGVAQGAGDQIWTLALIPRGAVWTTTRAQGGGRAADLEAGKVIQAIQRLSGGKRDARGRATAWQHSAMGGYS